MISSYRLDPSDTAAITAVRALADEAERADGSAAISDQAWLAATQGRRTVIGFETDDRGADAERFDAVGIIGEGELDLVVRPASRGRGVGAHALARLLEGADAPLRAWAHGENPAAASLLERVGFAPARTLYRMALDPHRLPDAIAQSRALPQGFTVRPFDPERAADRAEWVRVNAAAFADHPEQGAVTLDDLAALIAESWFDTADLMLAHDEAGALAGYAWVKTTRPGQHPADSDSLDTDTNTDTNAHDTAAPETELYVLGVDPAHAGIGLGAALLGIAFRVMAPHGPTRISLYVDGSNRSAIALYERAGFEIDTVSTQWLLPE